MSRVKREEIGGHFHFGHGMTENAAMAIQAGKNSYALFGLTRASERKARRENDGHSSVNERNRNVSPVDFTS